MAKEGYLGPYGVDAMLYQTDDGLLFKPVVELNPRHTMGMVSMGLRALLAAQRCGLWVFLSLNDVRAAGFSGFDDFVAWVEQDLPVQLKEGRVAQGILWTTDPADAESILTFVIVGRDLDDVFGQWRRCIRSSSQLRSWFEPL